MHNLFDKTCYVVIETHNRCNYANVHKRCPASLCKTPTTLKTSRVIDILDTLGKYKYAGSIAFYLYNEPLLEPRLAQFIKYAKEKCPESITIIGTNGWLLTTQLALDLYDVGLDFILTNGYSEYEYNRLKGIRADLVRLYRNGSIKKQIAYGDGQTKKLDVRMSINTRDKILEDRVCYAPLTEIIVRSNGDVPLCCMDSAGKHLYGNVNKQSFEETVTDAYPKLQALLTELAKGVRTLDFCKRCFFKERWGIAYKDGKDRRHKRWAIV